MLPSILGYYITPKCMVVTFTPTYIGYINPTLFQGLKVEIEKGLYPQNSSSPLRSIMAFYSTGVLVPHLFSPTTPTYNGYFLTLKSMGMFCYLKMHGIYCHPNILGVIFTPTFSEGISHPDFFGSIL